MFRHNTFRSTELFRWISIGLNYLQHCQFKNASIIQTCNLNRPYYHVASKMMQIVRHTYTTSYKQQTICNFFNRYWIDSKFLFLYIFFSVYCYHASFLDMLLQFPFIFVRDHVLRIVYWLYAFNYSVSLFHLSLENFIAFFCLS